MKTAVLRNVIVLTVYFLCFTLEPSYAASGDVSWNGARLKSDDGAFDIRFGGRIHNDWSFASPEKALENNVGRIEDGAEIRRAWVYTSGTVYKKVVYKAMYALEGGDPDLLDMYIGLKDIPYVGLVRVGHIREPFGLAQQNSCNTIMFLERSTVHELLPFRSMGAVTLNDAFESRVTWALGLYRDSDSYGRGTGEHSYSLVGRVTTAPILTGSDNRLLHLGMGINLRRPEDGIVRYYSRPEVHIAPYVIDTGNFNAATERIMNAEIAAVLGAFSLQHESFVFLTSGGEDHTFFSGYIQGSWCLKGSRRTYDRKSGAFNGIAMSSDQWYGYGGSGIWEIAARYSYTDIDDGTISGGRLRDYTLGLNWYLNPAVRVMVNYINAEREDTGTLNSVVTRFQVKF